MSDPGSPLTPPQPENVTTAIGIAKKMFPQEIAILVTDAFLYTGEHRTRVLIDEIVALAAGWRPPVEGPATDAASDQAPDLERATEPSSELAPSPLRQLAVANARIGRLEKLFNQSRRDAMRVIRALGLGEDDAIDDVVARAEELFDRSGEVVLPDTPAVDANQLATWLTGWLGPHDERRLAADLCAQFDLIPNPDNELYAMVTEGPAPEKAQAPGPSIQRDVPGLTSDPHLGGTDAVALLWPDMADEGEAVPPSPLRQGEGEPAPDVIERAEEIIRTWFDPGGSSRDEAIADHAQELAGAGLLATTPPTQPADEALAFLLARREAERDHARPRCWGNSSDALAFFAAAGASEPTFFEYPSDRADLAACELTYEMGSPRLQERMLPVLEKFRAAIAAGGVGEWLGLPKVTHKTEGGICCSGKHHICGGPGSYCCSKTVYQHEHTDGSRGPSDVTPSGVDVQSPTENESPRSWSCPPPPGVDRVRDKNGHQWSWKQPHWTCEGVLLYGIDLAKLYGPLTEVLPPAGLGGGQTKEDPPLSSTTDKD